MGICMGFENISVYASSAGQSTLEKFELYHVSRPIEFVKDPKQTKMFGPLGD
jgi:hypothetical protein